MRRYVQNIFKSTPQVTDLVERMLVGVQTRDLVWQPYVEGMLLQKKKLTYRALLRRAICSVIPGYTYRIIRRDRRDCRASLGESASATRQGHHAPRLRRRRRVPDQPAERRVRAVPRPRARALSQVCSF